MIFSLQNSPSRAGVRYFQSPHFKKKVELLVVVVQLVTSVQGVPGYETIAGTTPAPASVRRLSSFDFVFFVC